MLISGLFRAIFTIFRLKIEWVIVKKKPIFIYIEESNKYIDVLSEALPKAAEAFSIYFLYKNISKPKHLTLNPLNNLV